MSDLRFLGELGAELARVGEARAERHRPERRAARGPRTPRGTMAALGLGVSVLVVIAVVTVLALSLGGRGPVRTGSEAPDQTPISVTFGATAVDPRAALGPAITRAIPILRTRLAVVPGVRVSRAADGVMVTAPGGQSARARIVALALGAPAQLSFYDWEADLLTPGGKPLVKRLAQDPAAIVLSQGSGAAQPGESGAGALPLYTAVRLAARQPAVSTTSGLGRPGRQYYLFGAPGSAVCATVALDQRTAPVPGEHCMLLSGPVSETSTSPGQIDRDLSAALLPGISAARGRLLVVSPGTVVLQAARPAFGARPSAGAPAAGYFVLRDRVALAGRNVTDPHQGTDQSGSPDVQFQFTGVGVSAFERVTAQIAHRGQLVSAFHQSLNQHFAVAYGSRLITVPQIDFRTYPDGVTGGGGADITGGFTVSSARALAAALRSGPMPVRFSVR